MDKYVEVTCDIVGTSMMSWSKKIPKTPSTTDHKEWEETVWQQRFHTNKKGEVVIPPMALKNAMVTATRYLGVKIPGGGNRTFTKPFLSAVIPSSPESPSIGIHIDDVDHEWLFVPSDGKKGGGKRVDKKFPIVGPGWEAQFTFNVLDQRITKEWFQKFLKTAGLLIGLGRFRPENGGYYGRFSIKNLVWTPASLDDALAA